MIPHHPTHWIAVALAASLALLAFEVAGQQQQPSPGAQAVFQGRPALAGAQAGQGALAGPPQGGIGLQGTEGAQIALRAPAAATQPRLALPACAGPTVSAAQNPACLAQPGNERLEGRLARLGLDEPQGRGRM